jgi:hypothetical protein
LQEQTIAAASDITRLKSVFEEWSDLLLDELSDRLPNGTAIKDFNPKKRSRIVNRISELVRVYLIEVLGYPMDPYSKKRQLRREEESLKKHR